MTHSPKAPARRPRRPIGRVQRFRLSLCCVCFVLVSFLVALLCVVTTLSQDPERGRPGPPKRARGSDGRRRARGLWCLTLPPHRGTRPPLRGWIAGVPLLKSFNGTTRYSAVGGLRDSTHQTQAYRGQTQNNYPCTRTLHTDTGPYSTPLAATEFNSIQYSTPLTPPIQFNIAL